MPNLRARENRRGRVLTRVEFNGRRLIGVTKFFRGALVAAQLPMLALFSSVASAANSPVINLVVNAAGESPTIAPNTWVEIKGSNLGPVKASPDCAPGYCWQPSDFVGGQMPKQLQGISVTVAGKSAYVYYISPTQINVLTPPDALQGSVPVLVTNNGAASGVFTAQAQPLSPSFFVFSGGPYVAATHANGALIGSPGLFSGLATPAKPDETVVFYANGFGATSAPVVPGSSTQSGTLSPLPAITIGGVPAKVQFAGLVAPGEFQFNVVVPPSVSSGDNAVVATYNGAASPAAMITIQGAASAPASVTFYVAPDGNDSWSGTLAARNAMNTDGPLATFERARALVRAISKAGLTQIAVQFRGGTYSFSSTEMLTSADSGSESLEIVYQNYPGESPVFSGGTRVTNWNNAGGNKWIATLPASTQYFETLFYNGGRRLRPRLGASAASPLGTYYRIASTVYLNGAGAPPPPAQAPSQTCSVYVPNLGWECFDRMHYDPADPVVNTWRNLVPALGNPCGQAPGNQVIAGDVELLVFEQFSTSKLRVSCVDASSHIVYLTGPTGISQNNFSEVGFIAGNRYLIENVQDQLTQPGQWFLDRSTTPWTLTYLANSGENPNADSVIIPQIPQVLLGSNLQYVTFRGLTFEHDNYTLPASGHVSSELEADISAAVSFQNSQHIAFDSDIVTQTSGTGLELIPCINNASAPPDCVSNNINASVTNNVIENSAFFDIGALGVRIGNPFVMADTDANVPQFTTVQNNVVEGYGRVIPASFGIGQGMGHDNLYTHNDVYDGYHCAISTSQSIGDTVQPSGIGNANNVISFNHVYNLMQGIMNDGGSIRIDGGNSVFTAAGNKILNNKIHDVTDASIMDANGYGGHGIYMDDNTGLVDVENNLVYRVSGFAVYSPHGPAAPKEANIIRNNILAYASLAMVAVSSPYKSGVPTTIPEEVIMTNNIFYFDRTSSSNPPFRVQGGCSYAAGSPFASFEQFNNNLYWRTDGAFASDAKAFHVQPAAVAGPNAPCSDDKTTWTFYAFSGWQQSVGEDAQSVVQNPGFNNATYPADDFTLSKGSPGVGFVVFDPSLAGRSNPVIRPLPVGATFPTKLFNPAMDY